MIVPVSTLVDENQNAGMNSLHRSLTQGTWERPESATGTCATDSNKTKHSEEPTQTLAHLLRACASLSLTHTQSLAVTHTLHTASVQK